MSARITNSKFRSSELLKETSCNAMRQLLEFKVDFFCQGLSLVKCRSENSIVCGKFEGGLTPEDTSLRDHLLFRQLIDFHLLLTRLKSRIKCHERSFVYSHREQVEDDKPLIINSFIIIAAKLVNDSIHSIII